ncbi:hypothetical protein Srubr_02810 [Streptomyces rubradiris]|uniref:Uncharacterized protein n=2 Tax=Streptomyces rubradiris TaxID=285531 RepID=A0ABQ3R3J8_STRRR|nr:hypothetical protein GCM10018792_76540 [Streptomyces rubradiris]GHI50435.1 hypothetical protein Srubr_02810 [Streptomyces rubradiris]
MPPEAYRTFAIVSPVETHMRRATCEEVGCEHYLNGWRVRVENLTPQMLHAARTSGRKYVEHRIAEGETWLVYEAGQPCFKATEHRAPIGRPPLYLVRDGDYRGNPRGTKARLYQRPDQWVDDFATHQQNLADEIRKG